MDHFSEEQKADLKRMLESDTFRRAKERIIDLTDEVTPGLAASEFALQMAIEKGVRRAFKELANLARPSASHAPVVNPLRPGPNTPKTK